MIFEKSAGAIIYRKNKEKIEFLLLESKSISKKNPHNIWSFPKGLVEEGESDNQVALREIREETGITNLNLIPGFKITEKFMYRRDNELVSKTVNYFLAKDKVTSEVVISNEHIGFLWLSFEDAQKTIKIKAVRDSLLKANDFILSSAKQQSML